MCEDLQALKREAIRVLRRLKQVRRSRDISFFEDAELNRQKHASLHTVLKHLLVGHQGKPCPAANRPIVSPVAIPRRARPPARPSPRLAAVGVRQIAAQTVAAFIAWTLRVIRLLRSPGMESG